MSDVIYRGCTQPPMIKGVPLKPIVLVALIVTFLSFTLNYFGYGLWGILTFIPIYIVMRVISYNDSHYLNLWMLRLKFRLRDKNRRFYGAVVYSPSDYTKRE